MPVALPLPKTAVGARRSRFAPTDATVALLFALIPVAVLAIAVSAGGSESILAMASSLQP